MRTDADLHFTSNFWTFGPWVSSYRSNHSLHGSFWSDDEKVIQLNFCNASCSSLPFIPYKRVNTRWHARVGMVTGSFITDMRKWCFVFVFHWVTPYRERLSSENKILFSISSLCHITIIIFAIKSTCESFETFFHIYASRNFLLMGKLLFS